MAVIFLPVYIKLLGIEAYGLIGFFAVVQSLLVVFDLGVTPTLTREAARFKAGEHEIQDIRDLLRSFEYICISVSVLLVIGLFMASGPLARDWIKADALSNDSIRYSFTIMAFIFAARFLEGIYRGVLVGLDQQVRYNALNAGLMTVRYAGALIVLRYVSTTVEAFFIWQAVVSVLSLSSLVFFAYLALPSSGRPAHFSRAALRPVLRFSAGMTVVSGFSIALLNIDKLLISKLFSLDQFGHYALASVAASVLYILVVPITQGIYPRMVGQFARHDWAELAKTYRTSGQLASLTVLPAALCLSCFSREILYAWSGDAVLAEKTSLLLSILATAALANCIGHLGHNLLLVQGSTRVLAIINACALAIAVLVVPWAAASDGLVGAGCAWLVVAGLQSMVTILASTVRLFLLTDICKWFLMDILVPVSGALVVVWVGYWLRPDLLIGRIEIGVFVLLMATASMCVSALMSSQIRSTTIAFVRTWKSRYAFPDRR